MRLDPKLLPMLLDYAPETGVFIWRERTPDMFVGNARRSAEHSCRNWNSRRAGHPALTAVGAQGYMVGGILGVDVLAHRVAWAMTYGDWPTLHIDHINHDRADNRLCNLREVTRSENQRNQKLSKANSTGVTGVYRHKAGGFVAEIGANGEKIHLGYFTSIGGAISARKGAEVTFGYHQNHGCDASRLDLQGAI